ncbi:platelet glycoprotein VI-like, partial [Antechinus flavipes]|uniref:platelet glycoprotein VI-like n=1 Tax=Antechinus flavipes TaxID=38775 RepID=UPI002236122F
LYDPPFLSATPSSIVASGQNVSLQCGSELWYDMYTLYKDGEQLTQGKAQLHEGKSQTTFHFSLMTSAYGGIYRCYTFLRDSPYVWSAPSDPLELKVTGIVPPSPKSENWLFGE